MKKPRAKRTAKGKPVLAVPFKEVADTWPKATKQSEARTNKRIWIACKRARADEDKRKKALEQFASLPIPARMKVEVERVRECMAGDKLHDTAAVASVEAFFLGVRLQDCFPEFSRKIQPHTRATKANSVMAKARRDYARNRFVELRSQDENRHRRYIVEQIRIELKAQGHTTGLGDSSMKKMLVGLR